MPASRRRIATSTALSIFAAGHGAEEDFDWAPLARAGQPIVLYMVMHNLDRIAAALMDAGLAGATPAAVIASATTPRQRVLVSTLEKLAGEAPNREFEPPAIVVRVVVRWSAAVRERLVARPCPAQQGGARNGGARPHRRRAAGRARAEPVTLAVLAALARRGVAVRAAKTGPDYIDPAFHAAATGTAA